MSNDRLFLGVQFTVDLGTAYLVAATEFPLTYRIIDNEK